MLTVWDIYQDVDKIRFFEAVLLSLIMLEVPLQAFLMSMGILKFYRIIKECSEDQNVRTHAAPLYFQIVALVFWSATYIVQCFIWGFNTYQLMEYPAATKCTNADTVGFFATMLLSLSVAYLLNKSHSLASSNLDESLLSDVIGEEVDMITILQANRMMDFVEEVLEREQLIADDTGKRAEYD